MTTIYVTNANDSGAGSLRAAVAEAGNGDTIDLSTVGGTSIQLDTPLVIGANVTIDGDNDTAYHRVLIDGEMAVQSGAVVTLEHLYLHDDVYGQDAAGDAEPGADGMNGAAGQNGGANQPGTKGGDGDSGGDATMSSPVATNIGPALENDGTLTLFLCQIVGNQFGGGSGGPEKGADGAAGGAGGTGGLGGSGGSDANGAVGGIGGDGGAGSNGTDGGDAVGGVINTGALTIIDTVITGTAVASDGGAGGEGGAAGDGGSGGNGGPSNGNGGKGGNGGSGGAGGDGGKGGSAVGGIVNTGTVTIVGAAVLYGDSAQAGQGGAGGAGGAAGIGGAGGDNGSSGQAPSGMDGNPGDAGGTGASGTTTVDYLDKGATTGAFTINHYFYDFVTESTGQPSTVSIPANAGSSAYFSYQVGEFGGYSAGFPDAGSVQWKVVSGANGPPAGDFVGPTSGTLAYSANQSGEFLNKSIVVEVNSDAAAPQVETFTIEIFNPSSGNAIGSVNSVTQTVINQASNKLSDLTTLAYKASYEAIWRPATGVLKIVDTANANAAVATLSYSGATLSGELVTLSSDGASGTQVSLASAPYVTVAAGDVVVSHIPGQLYSSYEQVFDSGQEVGVDYFFTNVAGQAYSAYEYDYSPVSVLLASKFYYTGVTGHSYTGYEYDYDGGGHVTRADFTGVTGATYSSYEYDYTGGVFSGSKFEVTSVPAGATYSSYELDYNYASSFTGDKFFFTDISGQSYTGEEEDFDENGKLTRVLITGVTGQAYSSLEQDYDAGVYAGYKAFYNVTGQNFTSQEVDVSAAGVIQKVVYSNISGEPYQTVELDYSSGALAARVYGFVNVTGQTYYAYQVKDDVNGAELSDVFDLTLGGHTQIAKAAGQTLTSLGGDKMTGFGATTFALDAIYGADVITNFNSADTLLLPAVEYAQLQSTIQNGDYSGHNAMLSFSDGDTLTFKGLTQASLMALTSHISNGG